MEFRSFDPGDRAAVDQLLEAASLAAGEPALSEHKWARRFGSEDARVILGVGADGLDAYAQAAWHEGSGGDPGHWGVEVVFPDRPVTSDELLGLIEAVLRSTRRGEIRLWSGDPGLSSDLERVGHPVVRRLLRLRRAGATQLEVGTASPVGVLLDRFDPATDRDAWIRVNNAAFAGHPENGALTRADLAERMAADWFDPSDFLVARRGEDLVGFCWTKVHPTGEGEIYIIAVDPAEAGRGIGRWLLASGLDHLERARRVPAVLLYVEGDNETAIGLYSSAGFVTERTLVQFRLRAV